MGHNSLQKDSHARVPSIAYTSAGDYSFREDSQPKPSVRMQFFRVRVREPPLVHKRPNHAIRLRPVPGKGQRSSVGGDEA